MPQTFFSPLHSSAGAGFTGSGSHGLLAPVHPIWDGGGPAFIAMLALGSGVNLPEPSPAGLAPWCSGQPGIVLVAPPARLAMNDTHHITANQTKTRK